MGIHNIPHCQLIWFLGTSRCDVLSLEDSAAPLGDEATRVLTSA
jgi:hypothetical protein